MTRARPCIVFKPALTVGRLGERRFWTGIVAGVLFGASFFTASLMVGHAAVPALLGDPEAYAESFRQINDVAERMGGERPLPEPKVLTLDRPELPSWFETFWAGLSAALGQAVTLSVWFHRPSARRHRLHLRGSVASGLLWVGGASVLITLWDGHLSVLGRANFFAAAFGRQTAVDPLLELYPFGIAAGGLVVLIAHEPWRGIQHVFRCGRWVAASVTATLAFGGLLYLAGLAI